MRLIPLGQTKGQSLIRALTPLLSEIADNAVAGTLDDLSGTAFLTDIAAMKLLCAIFKDIPHKSNPSGPLRVGIGGPVGAGKTTLTAAPGEALRGNHLYLRVCARGRESMKSLNWWPVSAALKLRAKPIPIPSG